AGALGTDREKPSLHGHARACDRQTLRCLRRDFERRHEGTQQEQEEDQACESFPGESCYGGTGSPVCQGQGSRGCGLQRGQAGNQRHCDSGASSSGSASRARTYPRGDRLR
ncbi:unnamed protein product, partial [Ectocarpus sp. 12 AP-2014]